MGPFRVEQVVNQVTIRLPSSSAVRLFWLEFNLLCPPGSSDTPGVSRRCPEKYQGSHGELTDVEWDMSDIYVAEKIVKQRVRQGRREYFVKWKDYPESENTWEPEGHLFNGKEPCAALEDWKISLGQNHKKGRRHLKVMADGGKYD